MQHENLIMNVMPLPFKFIDLTHTLHPEICGNTGIGGCGFEHEIKKDYKDFKDCDPQFKVQQIKMHAGIGTHIDAPLHCFADGKDIASIPLNELIVPVVVINVSATSHERFSLSTKDIEDFEHTYGKIKSGSLVLVYTGWEKHWATPTKYLNNMVFPSTSQEAAELLLERNIVGLGMDTISPDIPENGFPVHKMLLGAGKYIVENVANANKLPAVGAYCFALPIKAKDCAEAPIRMVGITFSSSSS